MDGVNDALGNPEFYAKHEGDNVKSDSMDVHQFIQVPYSSQSTTPWCGLTSATMLLNAYGIDRDVWQVAADLNKPPTQSTSIAEMDQYLEDTLGWGWDQYKGTNYDDVASLRDAIEDILDTGRPIFMAGGFGFPHAVVIIGYNQGSVFYAEPSAGPYSGQYATKSWGEFWEYIEFVAEPSPASVILTVPTPGRTPTTQTLGTISVVLEDWAGDPCYYFENSGGGQSHALEFEWDGIEPYGGYKYVSSDLWYPDDGEDRLGGRKATSEDSIYVYPYVFNNEWEETDFRVNAWVNDPSLGVGIINAVSEVFPLDGHSGGVQEALTGFQLDPIALSDLTYDGVFELYLGLEANQGGSWTVVDDVSFEFDFEVFDERSPETPTPVSPADGHTLADLTPTFEWSAFQDGGDGDTLAGYQVLVRCDTDGDRVVYDTGFIPETNENIATTHTYSPGGYAISDKLEPGKHYHWHVRYRDSHGEWSDWSADDPNPHQDFLTPADDAYEQNDSFDHAAAIIEGTAQGLKSYDGDYYKIFLEEEEVLTTLVAEGFSHNIYRPNKTLGAASSGSGAQSAQYTATSSGWHFIYVPDQENASAPSNPDAYSLVVDIERPSLPGLSMSIPDSTADEPSNSGTFRISRTGSTASPLTVNFNTPTGSAIRGTDYDLKKGSTILAGNSVTIDAGQSYVDVTVAVRDDDIDEDDEPVILTLASGSGYTLGGTTSGTVTIEDDDTAGVTVSPASGLVTTETGGTAGFTVRLESQPVSDVAIGLWSSDTTEGTVSPTSLTFTPGDWNQPQTVTVTGQQDTQVDGNIGYTILTTTAGSSDPKYSGMAVTDVSVTNLDDDAETPAEIEVRQHTTLIVDGFSSFEFGSVLEGSDGREFIFTIHNLGDLNLTVGSVLLDDNNGFQVTQQPGSDVAGGGSTTFRIRMLADMPGAKSADVRFANGDANGDENPFNFQVFGNVEPSDVLLVDADASPGGDGRTWSTAYNDLQPALTQAALLNADGDSTNDVTQIWIAEGVYRPSTELEPGDARSAAFSLVDGVTLYGGFAGMETMLEQRDTSASVTTLSGDLGVVDDASDNAYTVVYCGEDIEASVDGLSITGGNADGSGNSGGGILTRGSLTVTNCTLLGNSADDKGGGIYNSGTLSVTNSTFSGNSANGSSSLGGGIYNLHGTLTVTNSTLWGNSAEKGGGIYNSSGTLAVTNTTLAGNSAEYGGGIRNYLGSLILNNSILWRNAGNDLDSNRGISVSRSLIGIDPQFARDPSDGGDGWGDDPETADVDESANDDYGDLRLTAQSPALDYGNDTLAVDAEGNPLMTDLDGNPRTYNGSAVDAGAYEFQDDMAPGREEASLRVSIAEDVVDLYDGRISIREAIYYAATGALENTITFDAALDGGTVILSGESLWIAQTLTVDASSLTSLTIDANHENGVFAVIAREEDTVELSHLTITGGSNNQGGGIRNSATLAVTNSTLWGNSARYGGAINNYGTLTVANSTLEGNSADGGGIYNNDEGTSTVINSALSGNSGEYGGAIYNRGTLAVTNSTLAGNSAEYGGGIRNYLGTLTVNNSIVAENTAFVGPDVYDSGDGILTGSHNLIGDGTGQTALINGTDGNLVGTPENPVDPLFVRAPSDGGDGWGDDPDTPDIDESANDDYGDLRLQPGSPAIDAGENTLLPADEFDLDGDGNTAEPIPVDLAGRARIEDGDEDGTATVDMGAYEFFNEPSTPGDLNADGMVNSGDLDIVRSYWGQSVTAGDLSSGDPSGDSLVGSADLDIVRANWGTGIPVVPFEILVSETEITVPEGLTAQFEVRLSAEPSGAITVTTARTDGDEDLSVDTGAALTFDATNWNIPQPVTLAAAEDADTIDGIAEFTVSADRATNQPIVTATEGDNDYGPFILDWVFMGYSGEEISVPPGTYDFVVAGISSGLEDLEVVWQLDGVPVEGGGYGLVEDGRSTYSHTFGPYWDVTRISADVCGVCGWEVLHSFYEWVVYPFSDLSPASYDIDLQEVLPGETLTLEVAVSNIQIALEGAISSEPGKVYLAIGWRSRIPENRWSIPSGFLTQLHNRGTRLWRLSFGARGFAKNEGRA